MNPLLVILNKNYSYIYIVFHLCTWVWVHCTWTHEWECACVHVFGSQRTSHTLLFCFPPYSLETKSLLVPGTCCFTCPGFTSCPPNLWSHSTVLQPCTQVAMFGFFFYLELDVQIRYLQPPLLLPELFLQAYIVFLKFISLSF